jgi:hypothetical protein
MAGDARLSQFLVLLQRVSAIVRPRGVSMNSIARSSNRPQAAFILIFSLWGN